MPFQPLNRRFCSSPYARCTSISVPLKTCGLVGSAVQCPASKWDTLQPAVMVTNNQAKANRFGKLNGRVIGGRLRVKGKYPFSIDSTRHKHKSGSNARQVKGGLNYA
jgi:hypothetical protein